MKQINKETLKKYLPFILGGLLLVALKFGSAFITKIRSVFAVQSAIRATNDGAKTSVQINGSTTKINLDTIASAIYYAFYNSKGKSRLNEDEKTAVMNVNKCPKELISNLSAVYAQRFGKVLKDDLISRLTSSQWDSIKDFFN